MCVQSSDKHIFKHIGTKSSINLHFQLIMFISNVIDSSLLIHARRYCHYISIHTLVYKPQHLCGVLDTFIWVSEVSVSGVGVSGVDVGLNVKMRIANVCQLRFLLIREGSKSEKTIYTEVQVGHLLSWRVRKQHLKSTCYETTNHKSVRL